jgi:hypothetical protein
MKVMRINELRAEIDPASTSIDQRRSSSSERVTSHFMSHGGRQPADAPKLPTVGVGPV